MQIFDLTVALCSSQGWGIFDCYFNPIGFRKVETRLSGAEDDPVWGGEDVENPALDFLSFPK